ncbi:hypothetical protein GWC77_26920 [Paraburkholderia sp. NMBU_R16]|uniref:HK97 family phage prohead protease n=1 Tax=Paraburkholderia sp. NMBU_R16 TaxID=2698676 RepID=UPI00156774EA|nr:HK97 family phage prohead protease [Paraburkholderia sp. NMBU_R16]NRO99508.1 hypothetical protein [Paraburkholderia sp. NMBU_R16]
MNEARIISGMATTNAVDRSGDVIDPLGAKFKTPFPLLLQHDHSTPIGTVTRVQRMSHGLLATAELVPPGVSEEADKAWGLIQAGALRGLSIGFRPLELSEGKTGINYDASEIYELSVVTVPCNADCYVIAHNTEAKAVRKRATEKPSGMTQVDVSPTAPSRTLKPFFHPNLY